MIARKPHGGDEQRDHEKPRDDEKPVAPAEARDEASDEAAAPEGVLAEGEVDGEAGEVTGKDSRKAGTGAPRKKRKQPRRRLARGAGTNGDSGEDEVAAEDRPARDEADEGADDSADDSADEPASAPAAAAARSARRGGVDDDVDDGNEDGADEARAGRGPDPATGADDETPEPLVGDRLRRCVEALLFASPEPLTRRRLRRLLREAANRDIDDAILQIEADIVTTGRGYHLIEDSQGLRFLTCSEFAPYVARLRGEQRRIRLSPAAFETLAVIAYRQPIGRADLDAIRGVQSSPILKRLQEWNLISIVGVEEDKLGRPHLYGTTRTFLEQFGIGSLEELPEPEQFHAAGSRLLVALRDDESDD